jgi:ankyrin repeat protein
MDLVDSYTHREIFKHLPFSRQIKSRCVNHLWNQMANNLYPLTQLFQLDFRHTFKYSLLNGLYKIVECLVNHCDKILLNRGLYWACRGGHLDTITLLSQKGATDVEYSFYGACRGGHIGIVELFLPTKTNNEQLSGGIIEACRGGHTHIVRMLIEKGDMNPRSVHLLEAYYGGQRDLVDYLIRRGCKGFNHGLCGACRGGHRDLVELMLQKGATKYDMGLSGACRGGHLDLVELMIEKGARDYDRGLGSACFGGHIDLAKYMIRLGAADKDMSLLYACRSGNYDLVEFMSQGREIYHNAGLIISCEKKYHKITLLLIQRGATACTCGLSIQEHQRIAIERSRGKIDLRN